MRKVRLRDLLFTGSSFSAGGCVGTTLSGRGDYSRVGFAAL